ncbi:MAG: nucleotidyltransferase [Planctomycetota bacterium]
MNRDFVEMLSALSAAGAEFLVVGAHALAAHGRPRSTGDLDLWVRRTPENAEQVWVALARFGAPLGDLSKEDLATPDIVFQIGQPPCRIDVLTSIDGVVFDQAWTRRITIRIDELEVPVLGRDDLLTNKRATGRPQDLADVAWLESRGAPPN